MDTVTGSHQHNPAPTTRQHQHRLELDELNDGELLEAFRAGCVESYGMLFTRYEKTALRVALRRTLDYHLAVDAVNEAFASILSALTAGKGPAGTFTAYLYASVIRQIQRQYRLRHNELSVPEYPDVPTDSIDLEDRFPDPALQKAFKSLPTRWRLVIWYIDINELPPRDAAPLFGLTPNAVSALHRRAKNGLRQTYLQHSTVP